MRDILARLGRVVFRVGTFVDKARDVLIFDELFLDIMI